jgi:CheY-like chemotaxis protein
MLQDLFGPEPATENGPTAKRSLAGKRILVVDDNEINLDVAAEAVLGCGAKVETASGGEAAVRMIEQTAFDLVLLDLSMPDLDGIAVGKAIRASRLNAHAAVLLFTAADADEAQRAKAAIGAAGYISKPVDLDQLLELAWENSNNTTT